MHDWLIGYLPWQDWHVAVTNLPHKDEGDGNSLLPLSMPALSQLSGCFSHHKYQNC